MKRRDVAMLLLCAAGGVRAHVGPSAQEVALEADRHDAVTIAASGRLTGKQGRTPLELVRSRGYAEVAKLIERGR